MIAVGIDPGKRKGYVCAINEDAPGARAIFWPSPVRGGERDLQVDPDEVARIVASVRNMAEVHGTRVAVALEVQQPRKHKDRSEGLVSAWSSGCGWGIWRGALAAQGFLEDAPARAPDRRLVIVEPHAWKRDMGCLVHGYSGEDTDAARRRASDAKVIEVARRVRPDERLLATERTERARADSPDKACALLMAEWVRAKTRSGT